MVNLAAAVDCIALFRYLIGITFTEVHCVERFSLSLGDIDLLITLRKMTLVMFERTVRKRRDGIGVMAEAGGSSTF